MLQDEMAAAYTIETRRETFYRLYEELCGDDTLDEEQQTELLTTLSRVGAEISTQFRHYPALAERYPDLFVFLERFAQVILNHMCEGYRRGTA